MRDCSIRQELNRRMAMAETWLLVAECLESCIRQDASGSGPTFHRTSQLKKACYYHYAIVVEITTKIIWAIDKGKQCEKTHDILGLYKQLSIGKQQRIKELYDDQVSAFKVQGRKGDGSSVHLENLVDLQSLEETMKANENTIRDFKYDGEYCTERDNPFRGMIWNSERIWILPEKVVIFPRSLLNYAKENLEHYSASTN